MTSPLVRLNTCKWLGLLLLAAAVVGAGFIAKGVLEGMNNSSHVMAVDSCSPDKDDCIINIDGENIKLSLLSAKNNFHAGETVNAVVSTSHSEWRPTQISLQGKTMYMGKNHFPLVANEHNDFINNIHFPVCITGRMTWQAIIQFDNNTSVIFEFDAE